MESHCSPKEPPWEQKGTLLAVTPLPAAHMRNHSHHDCEPFAKRGAQEPERATGGEKKPLGGNFFDGSGAGRLSLQNVGARRYLIGRQREEGRFDALFDWPGKHSIARGDTASGKHSEIGAEGRRGLGPRALAP